MNGLAQFVLTPSVTSGSLQALSRVNMSSERVSECVSECESELEQVLRIHPRLAVLQLTPSLPHSRSLRRLRRAVAALPHSPELRVALLTAMTAEGGDGRREEGDKAEKEEGEEEREREEDVFVWVRESLRQAGDHPGALPLWRLVLLLLRAPPPAPSPSNPSAAAHGHLPRVLAAYRSLLSLPAPPAWRELVLEQAAGLVDSLFVEGQQLCSSLPGIPPCHRDNPQLSALLPSATLAGTAQFIPTLNSLAIRTLSSLNVNESPVDDATIVWKRREYFETYLAAYLEQDVAYQSTLQTTALAVDSKNSRRKGGLLSVSGCYRVVTSGELDLWHGYLDSEIAAFATVVETTHHFDQSKFSNIDVEIAEWENCTFRSDRVESCRQSLVRLFERAVAADACILYPEIWRRYAMWLLNPCSRMSEYSSGGLQAALFLIQGALSHEPMIRSQSLRVLYADLLEYGGHVASSREVHCQLMSRPTSLHAPGAAGSGVNPHKRQAVESEAARNSDLSILTLAVAFECRQGQIAAAKVLLSEERSRCKATKDLQMLSAISLLEVKVVQGQHTLGGHGWNVPSILEQLACLFGTGTSDHSSLAQLKLHSLFRHEDDFPLVKCAFDLLLQLPPSPERDAQMWSLLSSSLTAAVYGVPSQECSSGT